MEGALLACYLNLNLAFKARYIIILKTSMLIAGCGPVGLLAIGIAKVMGATNV
jgi:threonine dehydrogenase-like Zn-dependent dehydrogenase